MNVLKALTCQWGPVLTAGLVMAGGILASQPAAAAGGDYRLRDAIRQRDAAAIQALLKQRVNVNSQEPDGATPLHWAAHFDDVGTVETLVKAGANPNVANTYGVTPLMLACENGNAATVQRLLKAGADANAALPSGETVLMTCARTGRPDAVAEMVRGGANVSATERLKGQNALMWALSGPHVEAARVLLDNGADLHSKSASGFTPLMFAARYNSADAVRLLLDRGARLTDQAADGATPFMVAVVRGHIGLAKLLLEKGADPNNASLGYTALHFAAGKWDGVDAHDYLDAPGEWNILLGLRPADKRELIKTLLLYGADPNARLTKEPPRYGFSLVSGSAKAYTSGATPFLIAAMSADPETMRQLVAGGADPNARSKNGSTALMLAAGMGWMENETLATETDYQAATGFCLELGIDPNAQNNSGMTVLHGSISGGFNKVIKQVAAAGADVNMKNKRGQTPLKLALGYGAAGGNHVREDTAAVLRELGGVE